MRRASQQGRNDGNISHFVGGLKNGENPNKPEPDAEFESCGYCACTCIMWRQTLRSILLCKGLSFLFSAFLFFCGEITQGFPASSEHVEPPSCRVLFTRRAHDLVFCKNLPYKTTQTICNNLLSFPLACSTWRKNNHNRKK